MEPKIKKSTCQKCGKLVRIADLKYLSAPEAINAFMEEVFMYNLIVDEITIQEYVEMEIDFCKCKF